MQKKTRSTKNKVEEPIVESPVDEKLQKVLARIGLGSRREMERAIVEGKVKVNGLVAKVGDRVTSKDKIEFDGRVVSSLAKKEQGTRVILYNKPEGEICTRNDPEGRPSVFRKLPKLPIGRWISVGRLDFNTTGLLLFTTDGELANRLMHPASEIDREYLVRIQGNVDEEMIARLKQGVLLEDGVAKFSDVQQAPSEGESGNQWFYCVVMEGRNREVRRLWESQDVRVSRLKRVRYGNIFIPSYVRMGQWVELNDNEVSELCETAGVDAPPPKRFSESETKARHRQRRKLSDPKSSGKQKRPQAKRRDAGRDFKADSDGGSPWQGPGRSRKRRS